MFLIPLLAPIISLIVGKLVTKAETEMPTPGTGADKKAWVMNFFDDLETILDVHGLLPAQVKSIWDGVKAMISDVIEAEVEKMKAKKA